MKKSRKKTVTALPTRFERVTKALLAVPEQELPEQKAIYERGKANAENHATL